MTVVTSTSTVPTRCPRSACKRKHTAPTGVASEDCFACAKQGIKCDRRRPYCSQCLKVSSTCSGYKMQLTWGFGVASRGKFRGLSVPIIESPHVVHEPKRPSRRPRTIRSASDSRTTAPDWDEREDIQQMNRGRVFYTRSVSQPPVTTYNPYDSPDYDLLAISCPDQDRQCYRSNKQQQPYQIYVSHPAAHFQEGSNHFSEFKSFPTRLIDNTFNLLGSPGFMSSANTSSYSEEDLCADRFNAACESYNDKPTGLPLSQSSPASIMTDASRVTLTPSPGVFITPPETSSTVDFQIDPLEDYFGYEMTCERMIQHHVDSVTAYSF